MIPIDGLLISSVLLAPRRAPAFFVLTTLGSVIGVWSFGFAFTQWGLPWLQGQWPELLSSSVWVWTEGLFQNYGLWLLLAVASAPILIHPVVVFSLAGQHSLQLVLGVVLAGRLIKYGVMVWVALKAPGSISRLWGLKHELEEVGIDK